MANKLNVNSDGLRIAAADSDVATAALAGEGGVSSNVGIAAMDAALSSLRRRQADRISGQAGDLSTGGARYDTTDEDSGDAITTVSV